MEQMMSIIDSLMTDHLSLPVVIPPQLRNSAGYVWNTL
jgi:hypothetical protein